MSKPRMNPNFWMGIITENDPRSSRRLITLLTATVFIITCVTVVTLLIITFVSITQLEKLNLKALEILSDTLTEVMYYEFMIVISGLSLITAPQFAKALVSSLSALVRRRKETIEDGDEVTTVETEDFDVENEDIANETEEEIQEVVPGKSRTRTRKKITK